MKIKRITREELEKLWNQDPDAVVALFNAMADSIENLTRRVEQLESQLHTDSHNSHKPPFTKWWLCHERRITTDDKKLTHKK